jgi:hypothetical protein
MSAKAYGTKAGGFAIGANLDTTGRPPQRAIPTQRGSVVFCSVKAATVRSTSAVGRLADPAGRNSRMERAQAAYRQGRAYILKGMYLPRRFLV